LTSRATPVPAFHALDMPAAYLQCLHAIYSVNW
jgi:hypothetical protein